MTDETNKKIVEFNQGIRHTGRQLCRHCDHNSMPGFMKGRGMCAYHWNQKMFTPRERIVEMFGKAKEKKEKGKV